MKGLIRIAVVIIAAAMFVFGAIMLHMEEKKAESTFYGATLVMATEYRNTEPEMPEQRISFGGDRT